MLRILGSSQKLCDGLTRRDVLHIGGLGVFGFGLADWLELEQAQAARAAKSSNFGKAKACILLFPYGSPPQHETFDPKPDAPAEVQGEMKSIATNVTGLRICDHLPHIAKVMNLTTVVRSMSHPYPVHGVAYATSGIPVYDPSLETRPRDAKHWPFIGSVVDYLLEKKEGKKSPVIPRNIGLPWMLDTKADLGALAGPYAAFLGQGYDPVWADFDGKGTKIAPMLSDGQKKVYLDPYAGVTPQGRFRLAAAGPQADPLTIDRLNRRRSLLEQVDRARARLDKSMKVRAYSRHQQMAYSLVTSSKVREALDLGREPSAVRESYGMTLFGQACLAARRLVEAGARFITVFWDAYEIFAGCAWDTHANHYPRLKEYLLPGFDLAYSGLLRDLQARGLLDETLVLWMSEHGRTPKIDSKPKGAGRHHWSRVYSAALAGGGVAKGKIVGSSDRIGGDVRDTPVSPKDLLATTFHLLGIDPHTTVPNFTGQPMPIAGEGKVRQELF